MDPIIVIENDESSKLIICEDKELREVLWKIIDLHDISKCGIKKERINAELYKNYQKLSEIFNKNN